MLWIVILVGFLLTIYSVLLLYYRLAWYKAPVREIPKNYQPQTRFSIIIAARNEEQQIAACLQSIQKLQYPTDLFEVIVVNDHSTDNTAAVVAYFPKVKLLHLVDYTCEDMQAHKKKAIEIGIQQSHGEYIITTDADCIVPEKWLQSFDALIQEKPTAFIAAPVSIASQPGLLNKFESLDFMMLQGITGAAVQSGLHVMSNGANLCYKKSSFESVKGFEDISQIASGDDMMLMYKIKKHVPKEIHYCKSKNAIVHTKGANNAISFFHQRVRWASKGTHYQEKNLQLILLAVFLLNLACCTLIFYTLFCSELLALTFIVLCIKTISELLLLLPVAKFFGKANQLWYYIPLQPIHILYMVTAALWGNLIKYEWKGRHVR